jgi:holliday junction DNA helicase RuvA
MIANVQGTVLESQSDYVVVMVGGVGLRVFVPFNTREALEVGAMAFLYTQLIVREDLLALYGFHSADERDFFNLLISVSGVGPKIALAILSTLTIDHLRAAVLNDRSEVLTRVPGIGKKTAQKLALELKDKLPKGGLEAGPLGFDDINTDVVDALVALGYSIVEAQAALQALPKDAPKDVEERVRLALQSFG